MWLLLMRPIGRKWGGKSKMKIVNKFKKKGPKKKEPKVEPETLWTCLR